MIISQSSVMQIKSRDHIGYVTLLSALQLFLYKLVSDMSKCNAKMYTSVLPHMNIRLNCGTLLQKQLFYLVQSDIRKHPHDFKVCFPVYFSKWYNVDNNKHHLFCYTLFVDSIFTYY